MKTPNKSLILILLSLFALVLSTSAQENYKLSPMYSHVFDMDSLSGFDEDAARNSLISQHYLGQEFKVKMYWTKRSYINDKYNLWPQKPKADRFDINAGAKMAVVPGCTNEDFEASTAGSVTAINQIAGWSITRGSSQPPNSACNLNGCCPSNPVESQLFDQATGFVDPVIGAIYPIFSVFGTNAGDPNGPINNPQLNGQPMFGDKFIRINSSGLGGQAYSIEKLSKTFAVTPANALFQFAFIFVTSTGHFCCSAAAFQVKLYNASANTVIACPSYSAAGPSLDCLNYTVNGIDFLVVQSGATVNPASYSTVFNKWKISSMDLTPYIGQNITIEVIVSDCDASGHYGYAYFDAQCGPMVVYGNGTAFDATVQSFTVPTCGASGATVCASSGLGPYKWAGPGVGPPYDTYSLSNQCYTTNISGQFTLFMNPPGSCAPIQRIVHTTITPAPLLLSGVTQAVCGGTTAVVSVTPSGSAAVPSTIIWTPTPQSINGSTTIATYTIPVGPAPTVVTITATDNNGCLVKTFANVNPAPPIPTFSVVNTSSSSSITCVNLTVSMAANTNYTYGTLDYIWAGTAANYTGQAVDITVPGCYTVTAHDPVTQCYGTPSVTCIGINTIAPTSTLVPAYQQITCAAPTVTTVTTTATPSINIEHQFFFNNGLSITGVYSNSAIVSPPPSGTNATASHTYILVNLINGCKTVKTFTVATSSGFPTFTITSPIQNYSIGCAPKNTVDINIAQAQTDPPGFPLLYAIMAPGASTYNTINQTAYSFTVPGTFTVVVKDAQSGCETKSPFTVIQNTFAPQIEVAIPSRTLSCFIPSVILTGSSTNPSVNYLWQYPGGAGIQPGATYTVNTTGVPSNTQIATYTFVVDDLNNACKSTTQIPMYQNIIKPIARISAPNSSYIRDTLSCITQSLTLQNASDFGYPSSLFPHQFGLAAIYWQGPSPQIPKANSTSYLAFQPGTYTMTARDMNNGCTKDTTIFIVDDRDYPVVNNPSTPPPGVVDCGTLSVGTVSAYISSTVSLLYQWYNNLGPLTTSPQVSSANNSVITASVNMAGEYQVVVTNTNNGCVTRSQGIVLNGTIIPKFASNVTEGFAPLSVTFNNQSKSSTPNASLATSGISGTWSFGNGNTQTVTALNYATPITQVYKQPGQYTVTLYVSKGSCIDDTSMVISVDIPSKLEVPNVFTPNGDGNNDVFFVRMANLTSLKISIYDRWGNLTYEVENSNGNVEWDGKNQLGKDAAEGTYFYMMTATGKDAKTYDTKGTINLFR